MSRWITVARDGELGPGDFKLVETEETDLAVFNVDGKLCCIEDVCTHDGGNLVEGDFEGCVVTCPRHGATFDVCTGEALSLPAVTPVAVFPVRVVEGRVEVEVED